jgi:biotin carboxylase
MNTAIVMSTRGFGVFRHDLLVDPGSVRFIGIFSEQDAPNLTDEQRQWFDQVHVVPCGVPDPTPLIASLVDAEAARRVIRDALTETDLDHLSLHSYDEQNVLLAAQLRTEFGIRGATYDQILPFRDKLVMKDRVRAAGVRVPRFGHYRPEEFAARTDAYFEEIVAEVGLPFILKPIDSAGAEGVHKVTSLDDFRALPADLGRDYEYEEFISGTMYSVNIVSKDRRTVFGGVTEYLVNSFGWSASPSGRSTRSAGRTAARTSSCS